MLALYACDPRNTKGRLYSEKPTPYRNEFERDRDRLIHSDAFRRLQYKTQVFINHEGDHYRNRLTHSIEVSSVARSIAKKLNLSDDLAEIVSLAHDLGHTPFGHAGEKALNSCMQVHSKKFSHNSHSLKILTKLERRYAAYDGLNLTLEVLEGIVKHNGPITEDISDYIIEYNLINNLNLNKYASAEAQIASLSDDIAYTCHDLEDSINANIIEFQHLAQIEILNLYIIDIRAKFKDITPSRLIYEVVRKLMHYLIESLLFQTNMNLQLYKIKTIEDIYNLGCNLVDFTPEVKNQIAEIKHFLFNKVYLHPKVSFITAKCQKIIQELFRLYLENPEFLTADWQKLVNISDSKETIIADYIAGMTDRFAISEYEKHYNINFSNITL